MVVTNEPGIYIPGKIGIRIEDTILVNKLESEVLTKSSKELIVRYNVEQNVKINEITNVINRYSK